MYATGAQVSARALVAFALKMMYNVVRSYKFESKRNISTFRNVLL